MDKIINVKDAPNGAILWFPFSANHYMKVSNPYTGEGAIVDITNGALYSYDDLDKRGIGHYCQAVYEDLNELYGL